MISRIELEREYIAERLRDEHSAAMQRNLVARCIPNAGLSRWVARPLGRALLSLGARLARYANPEPAAYVRARRAELN